MAKEYPNSGTLGRNKRKEKDSHPTHSGQATIDGKQYWISGWVKEGRDDERFFSLSFRPKQAQEHQGAPSNPPAQTKDDFDSEIPF